MIFTSYFGNWRKFLGNDLTPISIAKFSPNYVNYKELKLLAPTNDLLHKWRRNSISEEQYKKEFFELLSSKSRIRNIEEVLIKLDSKGLYVLLCYEKPGEFCHRHLLPEFTSKYLSHLNIEFIELGSINKRKSITRGFI